jgi:hypothetical protein
LEKASKGYGLLDQVLGSLFHALDLSSGSRRRIFFMQQDYHSVLTSFIMASARHDAQLRKAIYEIARSKLRQQLDWRAKELGQSERAQQLLELETAIEQVEADLAKNKVRPTSSGANVPVPVTHPTVEIIPPARHLPPWSEPRYETTAEHTAQSASSKIWWVFPFVGAAVLGAATYVAIERGFREEPQTKVEADQIVPRSKRATHSPDIPTPGAYGVYALTDGQLTELEPLPIKVPDPRVAVSGTISTASTTKLPNGRSQFIVFRRDLVNNAPEKVVVRVVAQVMRASASSRKGEATTSSVSDSWAVRGISYEMKVAPVEGNPAMILIRPADADFSFPAGRYALLLKAVAYDFSVDGPITDFAQCVERSDDLNTPVYTQCHNP